MFWRGLFHHLFEMRVIESWFLFSFLIETIGLGSPRGCGVRCRNTVHTHTLTPSTRTEMWVKPRMSTKAGLICSFASFGVSVKKTDTKEREDTAFRGQTAREWLHSGASSFPPSFPFPFLLSSHLLSLLLPGTMIQQILRIHIGLSAGTHRQGKDA